MSNLPPLVGQMNLQLEGRVVAITGAASGIGFATARAVGLLGGRAILGDFNEAGLTVAVDELQNLGMRVDRSSLMSRIPCRYRHSSIFLWARGASMASSRQLERRR